MKMPTKIKLHKQSRHLELCYGVNNDKNSFLLSCEYLRVFSPSAEVRGHGEGNAVLQWGKIAVAITAIKPVGNYAVQLTFDDGHDSGIYSWDYLFELAINNQQYWQRYEQQLSDAGLPRDPSTQILKL